jgi:hypothetical protein
MEREGASAIYGNGGGWRGFLEGGRTITRGRTASPSSRPCTAPWKQVDPGGHTPDMTAAACEVAIGERWIQRVFAQLVDAERCCGERHPFSTRLRWKVRAAFLQGNAAKIGMFADKNEDLVGHGSRRGCRDRLHDLLG